MLEVANLQGHHKPVIPELCGLRPSDIQVASVEDSCSMTSRGTLHEKLMYDNYRNCTITVESWFMLTSMTVFIANQHWLPSSEAKIRPLVVAPNYGLN